MKKTEYAIAEPPIDAVITWVDGSNESKNKDLEYYIAKENVANSPNVIRSRFDASGEITYCILSILKFAPFIRNIYIVTDGQRPDIETSIKKYFPDRLSSIIYISHQEIFSGYEVYLPIFNSRAIETMLFNIPGISESFIYFNDDFFLIKEILPEDWRQNKKLVVRGRWAPIPVFRLIWYRFFVPAKKRRASFHTGQWNAARVAGFRVRYFVFEHTPYAVSKSTLANYFKINPHVLVNNIKYRFRNPDQFNPCSLSAHLCLLQHNVLINSNTSLSYLQPYNRSKNYITNKLSKCENDPNIKFMCVQDLSLVGLESRMQVYNWLDKILGLS
ncbi:MAG: capsular biosynthesis protein [Bacteroidetes bacterium]|nr:capsular biosynthesis protein [Bacteroidota bacterium]